MTIWLFVEFVYLLIRIFLNESDSISTFKSLNKHKVCIQIMTDSHYYKKGLTSCSITSLLTCIFFFSQFFVIDYVNRTCLKVLH